MRICPQIGRIFDITQGSFSKASGNRSGGIWRWKVNGREKANNAYCSQSSALVYDHLVTSEDSHEIPDDIPYMQQQCFFPDIPPNSVQMQHDVMVTHLYTPILPDFALV